MTLDTDRFERLLRDERQRVVDAIDYLHHENPSSPDDETDEPPADNHLAETASITLDREIDYTLEENSAAVLDAIDAALARIGDGTYGVCEACGKQIPDERLEARPWARLCIDDQRKAERG